MSLVKWAFIGLIALPAAELLALIMVASLIGWFVCALFASVAYNWTFYYLLALAAAPRQLLIVNGFDVRTARVISSERATAPAHAGMAEA